MSTSSPGAPQHHNVGDLYPRKFGSKPDVVPSGVTERKVCPPDNKPDMVSVDVLNVSDSGDYLMHRKKQENDTYVLGTIHPFRKTHRSLLGKLSQEFCLVTSDRRSWRILTFAVLNLLCTGCLLMWCSSTNTLTAYTYLTIFDLFSLLTGLISSWVSMKKASQLYSYGFERLEVLAVFASTVLIQLGALFILKESVERFMDQPEVHTGRLLVGTSVALFFNLLTLLSVKNKPFSYVSEAASSSWLQEHVADLSRSVCGVVPGLSSVLLPRMNPFVLINLAGASSLLITYLLIEIHNFVATTPSHVSTLEGVLEVRNEHFWTVGFGSLAGSAHVRIRRDANEQLVLAHATNRLLPLVPTLSVQIFKDDWSRPALVSGPLPHLAGPPPEFSFNTPRRPHTGLGLAYPAYPGPQSLGPGPLGPPGASAHNYRTAPQGFATSNLPSQS
ncbi:hypothetical protein NHX12_022213, partial [Muraenolepis orangiensis]